MSFIIKSLKNHTLKEGVYLFDANIWITLLFRRINAGSHLHGYITFFQKFRENKLNSKIGVTNLIIGEVINRYLRDIKFNIFCSENRIENKKENYKKIYQKSHQYIIDFASICSEFEVYSDILMPINDGFGTDLNLDDIFNSPPIHFDYTDYQIYKLALKHKFIIVTDDSDFYVQDVEILTLNYKLINKYKDNVKPMLMANLPFADLSKRLNTEAGS